MRTTLSLLLITMLTACSTTGADFVANKPGYSVTSGRMLRVDGLISDTVTPLADGVAFAIDSGICRVGMKFENGNNRVLELRTEDILVCTAERDYVMQPAQDSDPERTRKRPPQQ